jgi:polyvinyl alcohol dehydrogenase (cytochrome)
MEWGSASDGTRIYVAISNYYGIPYAAGSAGSWAALDPATGKILWQVPDPNGSVDLGPVTAVNGVVYAPSMSGTPGNPTMLARRQHADPGVVGRVCCLGAGPPTRNASG